MAKRYGNSKRAERMDRGGNDGHSRDDFANQPAPYRSKAEPRSSHERSMFNDEEKHDRGNERAPERRFRAMGNEMEFYAGSEPRRRLEMQDAGYIHEDHDAIANLPQHAIIKPYPKTGPYMPEGLEDTIEGVDHQMDYDDGQRRSHFYPKKV